jgi:glycosyltransferase involved in cell wall biosynthesis
VAPAGAQRLAREERLKVPRDPIRIAALIEAATVTGPAKNLIRFASENRHLVDIRIFTFVRGIQSASAATNPFIDAARKAELKVHVIPEKRRFDLGVLGHLKQHFAEHPPQVVQTHSVKSHFLLALLGGQRPWIAFHHGYTEENLKMRVYNALDRYSLRKAGRVVTVCEAFVPQLERCGVKPGRVDILHNSIDPAWCPSPDEIQELRTSLDLAAVVVRILTVGRLSKEKGHATLIKAAAEARRWRPDLALEVLLVGDGPLRHDLTTLAKAEGMESVIRFVGQVGNVKAFFGVADVMVVPSFSEGSPNVVLEAMAARVPLVATKVGGVPEIVRDRETALLVPAGNSGAMAAALVELMDNAELRSRLAAKAHHHVAAEFTPGQYDARLMAIYQKVLAAAESS